MTKLGEILVKKHLISESQLESAIESQTLGRKKLGEILVAQGLIQPNELNVALQEQVGQQTQDITIPQHRNPILTWKQSDRIYQAIYSDELGQIIFLIQPKDLMDYQVCYYHRLAHGILLSETCGSRKTLAAAKDLAEEILKQLL